MAERSGFFDAHAYVDADGNVAYDRSYLAESFARYFASFIGNGVFGGKSSELMVRQKNTANMSVTVHAGQGWINGYWYENDDELSLAIDVADGILNRIDIIVLRWDTSERTIRSVVKKGTSASSPVAPIIQRDADIYELKLAEVYVGAGASKINQANITDTRLDSDVCGFVACVVDHIDTSDFNAQLNDWFETFKEYSREEVESLVSQLEAIVEAGSLGTIISDIQSLKDLTIESSEYPGCFYRVVNGNIEWINPPCEPGVEYRLVERFEDKTVFQTLINIASLPNASRAIIATNFTFTKVLSCEGVMMSSPSVLYAEAYPFPVYKNIGAAPVAMINGIVTGLAGRSIVVSTTENLSDYRANVIIKYVK